MLPDHIVLTDDLQESISGALTSWEKSKVGVLVDENTVQHCYPLIAQYLPEHKLFSIVSGEVNKNLNTCERIWDFMTKAGFERSSLLINLGGGVIVDMGGFCAATYKRGIHFMNIPTTLLAQVDASIGGKLGIDFDGYKNQIGLFQEPDRVIVYPDFIKTLNPRELRAGFAEIIKHCLIADLDYWRKLKDNNLENQDWPSHILHSIQTKYQVVEQDFKEKGLRKILNFGHTIGHAIETCLLGGPKSILHGEAVAVGMVSEAYLAHLKTGLSQSELEDLTTYIIKIFGKITIGPELTQSIVELALQDKKNESGQIRATLLKKIGKPTLDIIIQPQEIEKALDYYRHLENSSE